MKTKTLTKDSENSMFAFMPDMVIDHLKNAKPTETVSLEINKPVIEKITIIADPDIPSLDDLLEINLNPTIQKRKKKIKKSKKKQ